MRYQRWVVAALTIVVCLGVAQAESLKKITADLQAALQAGNAEQLRAAIGCTKTVQGTKTVKLLLRLAPQTTALDVHKDLVGALAAQREPAAVAYILKQAHKHRDWTIRYLLVETLAQWPAKDRDGKLVEALDDKRAEVAIVAMQQMAERRVGAGVGAIIAKLADWEKANEIMRLRAAMGSLRQLTGERLGDAFGWIAWWNVHSESFDVAKVKAKQRESSTVMRRIHERGDQEWIEKVQKGDIYCIEGQYDHVEKVLAELKLPHTFLSRKDFDAKVATLPATAVFIFNCTTAEQKLNGPSAKRLTTLIKQGAYVFTSDWELPNVVLRSAPGYIAQGATTETHTYPIALSPQGRAHPYMRDVFPTNPYAAGSMKWTLTGSNYCIKVLDKSVVPLVICPLLAKRYGSDLVACTFRYGRGAILHVLGHFDAQGEKQTDGFALQQMLLNFIVEKQKFRARK